MHAGNNGKVKSEEQVKCLAKVMMQINEVTPRDMTSKGGLSLLQILVMDPCICMRAASIGEWGVTVRYNRLLVLCSAGSYVFGRIRVQRAIR